MARVRSYTRMGKKGAVRVREHNRSFEARLTRLASKYSGALFRQKAEKFGSKRFMWKRLAARRMDILR